MCIEESALFHSILHLFYRSYVLDSLDWAFSNLFLFIETENKILSWNQESQVSMFEYSSFGFIGTVR